MFTEHKPYEPAFYSSVNADWGSSLLLAQAAGERARCLVDLGHHLPNTNVEQIVSRLAMTGRLGGFHFNDSAYGDDDLTVGSIDPYRLFLVVLELVAHGGGALPDLAYMIDASHNVKDPLEDLLQSTDQLQVTLAQALLVDRAAAARLRRTTTTRRCARRCCSVRTARTCARSSARRAGATARRSSRSRRSARAGYRRRGDRRARDGTVRRPDCEQRVGLRRGRRLRRVVDPRVPRRPRGRRPAGRRRPPVRARPRPRRGRQSALALGRAARRDRARARRSPRPPARSRRSACARGVSTTGSSTSVGRSCRRRTVTGRSAQRGSARSSSGSVNGACTRSRVCSSSRSTRSSRSPRTIATSSRAPGDCCCCPTCSSPT